MQLEHRELNLTFTTVQSRQESLSMQTLPTHDQIRVIH